MSGEDPPPEIVVLAGPNGAGKSSVAGAALRRAGGDYFDPDEVAQRIRREVPDLTLRGATLRSWTLCRHFLQSAIEKRRRFALETTLGGKAVTDLLARAADHGIPLRIWYVALQSVELHLRRVRKRADGGGHDVPDRLVRERYETSRQNLLRLLPRLTELKLYDNSREVDPARGAVPEPLLVLHLRTGEIVDGCPLEEVPDWAKPIVQRTLELYG